MAESTLVVVLLLAGVLLWSGAGKLRSPRPDAAFDALGVPAPLASRPIRRGLPWFEILLAGLLLVSAEGIAQIAVAGVTLLLFGAYLWLIARTLAARDKVSCNCFGSSAVIVNRWTLIRNILLVAAAAWVLVGALTGSRPVLGELMTLDRGEWAALLAAVGAAAVVGVIVRAEQPPTRTVLVSETPPTPESPDGLDYVRRPIPSVALESLDGDFRLLTDATAGSALLILFMSPSCTSCHGIEPLVPGWAARLAPVNLVVAVKGREAAEAMPPELRPHLRIDHEWATLKAVGGYGTPSAVLLGADGLLAGGPVGGADEVREFVDDIVEQLAEPSPVPSAGAPVGQTH